LTLTIVEDHYMRISAIILLGLCASASEAAQPVTSPCDRIQQLEGRIATQKEEIAHLLQIYTEQWPGVISARRNLTSLEASRTAEVEQARSQGVSCSSATRPDTTKTSSDSSDATKKAPQQTSSQEW
jgi:uncharacterized coiled-coil protein SlyX